MGKHLRILHLEDDPLAAELVQARLESEGVECETMRVDTRDGFISALENSEFDLILADYSLPSFDGLSALKIASEKCPELPYIFISGQMGEDIAVESLKSGATDYVLKDRLSRLAPAIRRALKESEDRAERRQAEENVRKLNRVYAVLSAVNHLIIRTSDRKELFEGACRILVEEGLFKMGWVGLVDEDTRTVRPAACSGCEDGYLDCITISIDPVPEGDGPTGAAVRTGRFYINNDTENNPLMLPWRDDALSRGYLSSAAFPLMQDGKVIGALTVYGGERFFFDNEEVRLLDALAADISYAIRSIEQEELRERAEAESRELSEKLQSLVEDALVGAYIMQDNRFIYVNRRIAEILGYTKDEILGMDAVQMVHPDDRAMVRENIRRRIEEKVKDLHSEFRMLKKDGGVVFVEVLSSYTLYQGKPSIIGSLLDITERKELEQQKTDFYAMITHDFKSPLTTILGYTEFILTVKADRLDSEIMEMVAAIQNSGVNLLHMSDDFLALSRIESGMLTLNLAPIDVSDILRRVSKDLEKAAHEKGLSLVEKFSGGLPAAMADQRLVRRAMANLLHNAINYTPSGGAVTLRTEAAPSGESGYVVVSVSDTGPGIMPGEREKIFDKYYRSPVTSGLKGTGLGLAIVKAVAEAHGGRVALESEEGKGSTFRMFLPTQPARHNPAQQ